ncbi:MAG: benzoyl-CoA 2,3-dioxygenase component A, partial [Pseudomonadales bacterium]
MSCPLEAIEHNDNNVVVDASKCNQCMDCIPVCPTGSIDEWRIVNEPYSLDEQYEWEELPEQGDVTLAEHTESELANPMDALLAEAHQGAGGKTQAPTSASTPTVNLYPLSKSIEAVVQGNYRITDKNSDTDVRHIILDFRGKPFPILEGQSLGILPPGMTEAGKSHLPRLYSASSPRDGERPGFHNVSLTVKRDASGICSNYLCDLRKGDTVNVIGPYGSTFLL